jgi:putative membrane-bound dehydrogenase-like protein
MFRRFCAFVIGAYLLCSPDTSGEDFTARELKPRTGLKPFEYVDAPDKLPNYTPNAQWGTQGQPIGTMQKPLAAAESMEHLVTFPEFSVSLFAAEPDIIKPLWLAWDARGRLWIAETVDYPNELQPEGQGRDRLKICEDTNDDGKADKFTIFADKLSIPTSFVFANGGVIVIHSGRTEFFKDTNGDNKADQNKVLFNGWGMRDTHATASNLRYGFDGWIWGTVGYSGFQGTVGGKAIRFGQGIFRFKPDGSALEFVRSSNNNTWGLGITEDNLILGSTANGNASMYMPIPNRYYEAVNGWSAARLETIADSQRFYPLTDKVRQVDFHGRYTAGSGSAIYTARSFPKEYWNRVQFVAEPTGHLLGQFYLERRGADVIAHNARNFAASDDEWTAPIYGEVGPDGALWLVDWYNYIVQHNPTPRGFRTGKGAAYETSLRDKKHGRIYRIRHKNAKPTEPPRLDKATPTELLVALRNDNMLWRMHAQRLLVERGNKDIVRGLWELLHDRKVDEVGLNAAAIHALWTLYGLGALESPGPAVSPTEAAILYSSRGYLGRASEAVSLGLKHPSAAVRRAAVMVRPPDESRRDALLSNKLLEDADAQVRMAALLALSEMPASDVAGSAVFAALQDPRNSEDRWITDAATCAAARNDSAFLKAAIASGSEPAGVVASVLRIVTTHYAQRGPIESIVPTLAALKDASPSLATAVLDGLMSGWPQEKAPSLSSADKQTLTALRESLPESARDRLLALAQRWSQPTLFGASVASIIESLKKQVADASAPDDKRAAAAKRLIGVEDNSDTAELILKQVNLLTPPGLAAGLVNSLGESRRERTGEIVLEHWKELSPSVRRAAIAVLMRRAEWAMALLEAVQRERISKTDLAAEHWSQLKQNPNRAVARRAERLAEITIGISADREEVVKRLLPLAKERGDAARGKEVYAANCAVCHIFDGQGGKVGPDLTGIAARDRADILLEILDPNRSVEANYRLWNVTTRTGETFSGRLEAETQTTVEILDTTAQKHVIQRKDITSLEASALSIMPAGFESLPPDDLKALIEYLARPHEAAGGTQ